MNWAAWIVAACVLPSACESTPAPIDAANQSDAQGREEDAQTPDGQTPVDESRKGDATPGTLASLDAADRDQLCSAIARKRDEKTCGPDATSSGAVPSPDTLFDALCNIVELSPFFFACSATVAEVDTCFEVLAKNCWMTTTSSDCSRVWHCFGPVPSDPFAPSDAGSDATEDR
jgi:hypothetical protein